MEGDHQALSEGRKAPRQPCGCVRGEEESAGATVGGLTHGLPGRLDAVGGALLPRGDKDRLCVRELLQNLQAGATGSQEAEAGEEDGSAVPTGAIAPLVAPCRTLVRHHGIQPPSPSPPKAVCSFNLLDRRM